MLRFFHFIAVLEILLSGKYARAEIAVVSDVISPFKVESLDNLKQCSFIAADKVAKFKSAGYTKVACPFEVMVLGTSGYADKNLQYAANFVAHLLDTNGDGVADDAEVVKQITGKRGGLGGALQCGTTQAEESKGSSMGEEFQIYTYSCQTWKAADGNVQSTKSVLEEEVFHMIHTAQSTVHPSDIGIDDFTSIAAKEMKRLQCVQPGWFHPENQCPAGAPFTAGNAASTPLGCGADYIGNCCNDASCDVAEFYKQAIFLTAGFANTGWLSDYMPTTQAAANQLWSAEFKAMMKKPSLFQLQTPRNAVAYNPTGGFYKLSEAEQQKQIAANAASTSGSSGFGKMFFVSIFAGVLTTVVLQFDIV